MFIADQQEAIRYTCPPSFFGRKLRTDNSLPPSQALANRAGSAFFGIDAEYIARVQKREIFNLVEHGFSYESLIKMPLDERRYYFHLLIEKNTPQEQDSPESVQARKEKLFKRAR